MCRSGNAIHTPFPPRSKSIKYLQCKGSVGQHWHGTSLVLDPGGLEVLDQVEEVLAGHGAALLGDDALGVWRALVIDAGALYKEKGGKDGDLGFVQRRWAFAPCQICDGRQPFFCVRV